MLCVNSLNAKFLYKFLFANLLYAIRASERDAFERCKMGIKECIERSENFQDTISDLEYTLMSIDDHQGYPKNVLGLFSEILRTSDPDDVVTVIEIKKIKAHWYERKDYMPELMECLQDYVLHGNEKDLYTDNIQLRVSLIRNRNVCDLHEFDNAVYRHELVEDKIYMDFVDKVEREVRISLYQKITKEVFLVITRLIFYKFKSNYKKSVGSCTMGNSDYVKMIKRILRKIQSKKFLNVMQDEIYRIISQENGIIDIIATEITDLREGTNFEYFDANGIRSELETIYRNEYKDIVQNILCIEIEKIADCWANLSLGRFENIYKKFIESIITSLNKNKSLLDHQTSDAFFDEYKASEEGQVLFFGRPSYSSIVLSMVFNGNIDGTKCNFSKDLIKIKSKNYHKCAKIICNDNITKDNIKDLYHMINNSGLHLQGCNKQILCINMHRGYNLHTISLRFQHLLAQKPYFDFASLSMNMIEKINLTVKNRGNDFVLKSAIDLKAIMSAYIPKKNDDEVLSDIKDVVIGNAKICDIRQTNSVYLDCYNACQGSKRLVITCHSSNGRSNEDVKILLNFDTKHDGLQVMAEFCGAKGDQNLLPEESVIKSLHIPNSQEENYTVDPQHIFAPIEIQMQSLLNWLNVVQYSYQTFLPRNFRNKTEFLHLDQSQVINCVGSDESLNEKTSEKLCEIGDIIDKFYSADLNTNKIISTEINLIDFLRRKINRKEWTNAIKKFVFESKLDKAELENILERHLIDNDSVNATSSCRALSIKLQNYRIKIYAILRKNSNTMVYLVRRDVGYDLRISPYTFAIRSYVDESNRTMHYDPSNPIYYLLVTNRIQINPDRYIFKTMLNLGFNMLGDLRDQYETNKDKFLKTLMSMLNPMLQHKIPAEEGKKFGSYTSTQNQTLLCLAFIKIMYIRIEKVIQNIELHKTRIKSSTSIKTTLISMQKPDNDDLRDIANLYEKLSSTESKPIERMQLEMNKMQ